MPWHAAIPVHDAGSRSLVCCNGHAACSSLVSLLQHPCPLSAVRGTPVFLIYLKEMNLFLCKSAHCFFLFKEPDYVSSLHKPLLQFLPFWLVSISTVFHSKEQIFATHFASIGTAKSGDELWFLPFSFTMKKYIQNLSVPFSFISFDLLLCARTDV